MTADPKPVELVEQPLPHVIPAQSTLTSIGGVVEPPSRRHREAPFHPRLHVLVIVLLW